MSGCGEAMPVKPACTVKLEILNSFQNGCGGQEGGVWSCNGYTSRRNDDLGAARARRWAP